MKKILLFVLTFFLSFNSIVAERPWWSTCIVDAGGALGGGAAVVEFTAGAATLNPVGWIAVGAGALIGGAAASLAIAAPPIHYPAIWPITTFPRPDEPWDPWDPWGPWGPTGPWLLYSNIGGTHNQLVTDYREIHSKFDIDEFYKYVETNKEKYGILKLPSKKQIFKQTLAASVQIENYDQAINYISQFLPNEIDKEQFNIEFIKILQSKSVDIFIQNAYSLNYKIIQNEKYSLKVKFVMNSFFSVLCNSAVLYEYKELNKPSLK